MAFFDVPTGEALPPESARLLEEYRKLTGAAQAPETWRAYGRFPRIIDARKRAAEAFHAQCSFPADAKYMAAMLIAHARRCQGCFLGARSALNALGFDEPTLDAICADPETLPLPPRSRRFVYWALRFAGSTPDLTPKDFRQMADDGFSREEVQEIIALATFWVMNTMFNTAARTALTEE
jgi:alkylhydroperoxidase family enzyme